MLRKLCRKGAARNERAVVTPLLTREQVIRAQGEELAVKAGAVSYTHLPHGTVPGQVPAPLLAGAEGTAGAGVHTTDPPYSLSFFVRLIQLRTEHSALVPAPGGAWFGVQQRDDVRVVVAQGVEVIDCLLYTSRCV